MNKLWHSERGAVSIFFMIILAAVFLFQAIFVDFARIKAAEYETERAVKAAVRSLHAGYDLDLATYGLYAIANKDEMENVVQQVTQDNLPPDQNWFSSPELGEIEVSSEHALANHGVFEQQILEEMKYAAPIEYMTDVWEKWKAGGLDLKLSEASRMSDKLKDLESIIEEREDALDEAMDMTIELVRKEGNYHRFSMSMQRMLSEMDGLAGELGIHSMHTLTTEISQISQSMSELSAQKSALQAQAASQALEAAHDNNANADTVMDIQASIEEIENSIEELSEKLSDLNSMKQAAENLAQLVLEMKMELEASARRLDGIIGRSLIEQIEHALQEAQSAEKRLIKKLEEMTEELDLQIHVYGDNYFADYRSQLSGVHAMFTAYGRSFQAHFFSLPERGTDVLNHFTGKTYMDGYTLLQQRIEALEQKRNTVEIWVREEDRKRNQRNEKIEDKKNEQRDRAEQSLNKLINTFKCPISGDGQLKQLTGQDGLYHKYLSYNAQIDKETEYQERELEDPDKVGTDSFDFIDIIQNALLNFRDEVYVNEYALTKFNYRTMLPPDAKDSSVINQQSFTKALPHAHTLYNQEVEYILYGLSTCEKNLGAAYGEIFLVRMAVNLAEALASPNKQAALLVSPWLLFLWAVAEAAIEAWQEMGDLIAGKEVPLSDKWARAVTFNYKDYLRIFLLLHSQDTKMMSRMQALIELNTGKDLINKPVYTRTFMTFELEPVFFTAVLPILGRSSEEGEIVITHEIYESY
ncbi:DUF5702 domain-containing protein [Marinicrinis sediminis]|uniref:DUF5702 domain-containing protein n=1 Tax=Marinicrinis sediminis TaxID=1652465 RepID=A0ABW5RE25_9BACL